MQNVISQSPIEVFFPHSITEKEKVDTEKKGQLGFVCSGVGAGKSLLLCHVGIHTLLQEQKVLHISLHSPQQRVREQYNTLSTAMLQQSNIAQGPMQQEILHNIEKNRLVHAYLQHNCTVNTIAEKIQSFIELLEFHPKVVLVDDFFHTTSLISLETIEQLQVIAKKYQIRLWMSIPQKHTQLPTTQDILHISIENATQLTCSNSSTTLTVQAHNLLCVSENATITNLLATQCTMFSGGAMGAETLFGEIASQFGLREINFTYAGQQLKRMENVVVLSPQELATGSTSLAYVSKVLRRDWERNLQLRSVLQVLWHIVSHAEQLFIIGIIQPDNTVHGGTGWSVELAKRWQKPVWVYDQDMEKWMTWDGSQWVPDIPVINKKNIAGSGTRFVTQGARTAILELFTRSFGN